MFPRLLFKWKVQRQIEQIAENQLENSDFPSFCAVIDDFPSKWKVFIVLGMFLLADLLKARLTVKQAPIIHQLANLSLCQRLKIVFQLVYEITVTFSDQKVVLSRIPSHCPLCGHSDPKMIPQSYPRKTIEFLRDLGIEVLTAALPPKIHIQRAQCQNPRCRTTFSTLRKEELPYSIHSLWGMDFILTTYLNSGASLNVIAQLCRKIGRPISPAYIWQQIQFLGRQFPLQIKQLKSSLSGHFGVDECYPTTIEGKVGIMAVIDQLTGYVFHFALAPSFDKERAKHFVCDVWIIAGKFYSLTTDLSTIYSTVRFAAPCRILHLCCVFHVKRNLKEYYAEGYVKINNSGEVILHSRWLSQLEALIILIDDVFVSPTAKAALEKLEALLQQEQRWAGNPAGAPIFKYLRNHQDLLIHAIDSQIYPTTNNLIERYFGHIRHKLKNVRGWKRQTTLLCFVQALAIYRNYLALQSNDVVSTSLRTGDSLTIRNLTFGEYLYHFLVNVSISSPTVLPLLRTIPWENIFREAIAN